MLSITRGARASRRYLIMQLSYRLEESDFISKKSDSSQGGEEMVDSQIVRPTFLLIY